MGTEDDRLRRADAEVRAYIDEREQSVPPLKNPGRRIRVAPAVAGLAAIAACLVMVTLLIGSGNGPDVSAGKPHATADNQLVTCNATDVPAFSATALAAPLSPLPDNAESRSLRAGLSQMADAVPEAPFRQLTGGDGYMLYGAGDPDRLTIAVVRRSGSEWKLDRMGPCVVAPYEHGTYTVSWQLAPGSSEVAFDAMGLDVVLDDTICTSVPLGERLQNALISYGEDAVTVTFRAALPQGDELSFCPDEAPLERTIAFSEPVAGRAIADASVYPPQSRVP